MCASGPLGSVGAKMSPYVRLSFSQEMSQLFSVATAEVPANQQSFRRTFEDFTVSCEAAVGEHEVADLSLITKCNFIMNKHLCVPLLERANTAELAATSLLLISGCSTGA